MSSTVIVNRAEGKDIELLCPILETWLRDSETGELLPNEVEEVLRFVRKSVEGHGDRVYLVARDDLGKVLGMVGFKPPEGRMREFAETGRTAELINAFVAREHQGEEVGRALVAKLEEEAKALGYKEIVLNSGPRYRDTGWGFYDKLEGYKRVGVIEDMYGEDKDAVVWRKLL